MDFELGVDTHTLVRVCAKTDGEKQTKRETVKHGYRRRSVIEGERKDKKQERDYSRYKDGMGQQQRKTETVRVLVCVCMSLRVWIRSSSRYIQLPSLLN